MPVAMGAGALLHGVASRLDFLVPYLIFSMLYVTFCRVSVCEMRPNRLVWTVLALQLSAAVAIYLCFSRLDDTVAQRLMICSLAPAAMASVVIGGLLGANVATMATFCFISNLVASVSCPLFFAAIGVQGHLSYAEAFIRILSKVGPLLILPFVAAWLTDRLIPRLHEILKRRQGISFWIWVFSLVIVTGQTVEFISAQPSGSYLTEFVLAGGALAICLLQFSFGRFIGRRMGDTAAGGQTMGQKNTILAIWMCQSFLNPLASVAPALYVLWQNLVNSFQLYRKNRADAVPVKKPGRCGRAL